MWVFFFFFRENLWFDDLCAEYIGAGFKFVFSPDVIFRGRPG